MMRPILAGLTLAAVVAAGAGGYWAGRNGQAVVRWTDALGISSADAETDAGDTNPVAIPPAQATPERVVPGGGDPSAPILYWRDPDGRPSYSAAPRQTSDGRDFVAVLVDGAGEGAGTGSSQPATEVAAGAKTVLYYRNPMGLPDTSPVPTKDSMGMDYIPVFDGPEDEEGIVTISPGRIQRTGVRSVRVEKRSIELPLKVPGVVRLDERRISVLATRADAFVEEVADVTTGSSVKRGDPLVRLYSPEMAAAAAQFVLDLKAGSASQAGGARLKLRNLGVPDTAVAQMEETRSVPTSMTWAAPQDGLVLERMAVDGMMTKAGEVLFRLGDASKVWIVADVPESRIANVRPGAAASATLKAFPGRRFTGTVDLVYPEVSPATRTVKVRIEVPNGDGMLLPDMYADVDVDTGSQSQVVAVPNDALVDTGSRRFVILDRGEGRFEPRSVETGVRGDEMTEILSGVTEGDEVVVGANFLIDAESNIKAALSALDSGAGETVPTAELRP